MRGSGPGPESLDREALIAEAKRLRAGLRAYRERSGYDPGMNASWDPGMVDRVRRSWDVLVDDYDRHHGDEGNAWHRLLIEPATLELLGDVRGKRILDLGCGTGVLARCLARSGGRVVGVDGSEAFLERARRHGGEERIEWAVVDALDEEAVASLGAFEAIVCTMVLMDLPDLGPLFRGIRRVLSNGPFVVATAHLASTIPMPTGFVLDALKEPIFWPEKASGFGSEFPPVLAARLRPAPGSSNS